MTKRQTESRAKWRLAKRAYRNAAPGERNVTRRKLNEAATAVLVADTAARKREGVAA